MDGPGSTRSDREQRSVLGRTVAGKFVIESYLGGGAMGAVYRARQTALDKDVAIKLLHGQHAGDPTFVARFQREAKAASKLDHPNSVRVIDFGQEPDGLLYIAMEFLDGRDLFRVITDDWPLPAARVADIVSQALAAVAVAHEQGVVHRDLKPENIMVQRRTDDEGRPRDEVKVCDFGIAKFTGGRDPGSEGAVAGRAAGGQKLTTQGLVVGTPEYMSPEQARGEGLDARSDVYAMGVILYQMLTGQVPFDAETALAIVLKHVTEEPPAPRAANPQADPELEAICLKAMSKKREDRYQTAREMRADLRAARASREAASYGARADGPSGPVRRADPEASTAVAIDSSSVKAAAQLRAAAVSKADLTPPGTAALSSSRPSSLRGPGWLAVGAVALAGAVAGALALRAGHLKSGPTSQAAPSVVAAAATAAAVATVAAVPEPARVPPLDPPSPVKASSARALVLPVSPAPRALAAATAAPAVAAAPVPSPDPLPSTPPIAVVAAPPVPPPPPVSVPIVAAPAPPAAPSPFDPSHAHVAWSVGATGGGATASAVQRALARKSGAWTACYRHGLEARGERTAGSGVLHLTTDESGNVVGASMNGFDAMPGVKGCIATEAHVHLDNVDTGDAWAEVQLTFLPE